MKNKESKSPLNELDRARLLLSREHSEREREAEKTGGFLPTPPMLIHEVAHLADIYHRGGGEGIRYSRRSILTQLTKENRQTQQALAAAAHLTAATVSVELGEMEKEGLVTRRRDPLDGRQTLVEITEKGVALLAETRARMREQDGRMMEGFSREETEALRRALTRVRENLIGLLDEG